MAEGEILALADRNIIPDDNLIFSLIGERRTLWQRILDTLSKEYKDISWSWNYYNDGHRWLFKLVQKKKTVFWGAVLTTGEFRITFYFADRAEPLIEASDLSRQIKDDFRTAKKYGAIRPASILVNCEEDVESVLRLADIRIRMK